MKNLIKLSEGDLTNIIKRVIRESINESVDYYDKIISLLEKPYFQNLITMGIPEEQWEKIFSKLYGEPVQLSENSDSYEIFNDKGNIIYYENSEGYWVKREFNKNGKVIYFEDSKGYWWKREYNDNGKPIYYENSEGYWYKKEYDNNGNRIYYGDSEGEWSKREYDENNDIIYREDSDGY
jgi:hypothetical protein